MSLKVQIATAGNVIVPAYLTLKQKGFKVWWIRSNSKPDEETWYAEDASRKFMAEDPVALLGLILLHEVRGDNWQASDEEIDDFLAFYAE